MKSLLNDKQSKGTVRLATDRLINEQIAIGLTERELANNLAYTYLPLAKDGDHPLDVNCMRLSAPDLDQPFTVSGIRHVLFNLNDRSAPGPDGVTNKLLRNLDDRAIKIVAADT